MFDGVSPREDFAATCSRQNATCNGWHGVARLCMAFAQTLDDAELAFGFQATENTAFGRLIVLPVGSGLRAVKMVDANGVNYAICDDALVMLYAPARSLFELRARFGIVATR